MEKNTQKPSSEKASVESSEQLKLAGKASGQLEKRCGNQPAKKYVVTVRASRES